MRWIRLQSSEAAGAGVSQRVLDLFAKEAVDRNVICPAPRPQPLPNYPALLQREQERHAIEKSRRRSLRRWF